MRSGPAGGRTELAAKSVLFAGPLAGEEATGRSLRNRPPRFPPLDEGGDPTSRRQVESGELRVKSPFLHDPHVVARDSELHTESCAQPPA